MPSAALFSTIALVLALGGGAARGAPPPAGVRTACATGAPANASVPGIKVTRHQASSGDLPYVEARSVRTGSTVRIYHDEGNAKAMLSKAACLGALVDMVRETAPDSRRDIHWSAVTATTNAGYLPPRDRDEAQWLDVLQDGRWDEASLTFLILTMPHEETHFSQDRPGAPKLPRWFQEGHAEWSGLHVTEQVRPDLAQRRRADIAASLRAAGKVHLGQWGGVKIKPEAIERQLSAEDRAKRSADPSYIPKGPFHFGPGDFFKDDENGNAYYAASLAIFDDLEARHGRAAVQAWVSAVLASADNKHIVELAKEKLGEDISPLLL